MNYPTIERLLEATEAKLPPSVVDWLRKNAPIQYESMLSGNGVPLLRGFARMQMTVPHVVTPPNKYRPAANTGDLYKVLMDLSNPDFPRRGYSTVCTTSYGKAGEYGTVWHLIPPDNCKVGEVNAEDMWDTAILDRTNDAVRHVVCSVEDAFGRVDRGMVAWDAYAPTHIEGARNAAEIDNVMDIWAKSVAAEYFGMHEIKQRSWYEWLEAKTSSDRKLPGRHVISWLFDTMQGGNTSFTSWMVDSGVALYSEVGITQTTAAKLIGKRVGECWFEGPYVAIPTKVYQAFRKSAAAK